MGSWSISSLLWRWKEPVPVKLGATQSVPDTGRAYRLGLDEPTPIQDGRDLCTIARPGNPSVRIFVPNMQHEAGAMALNVPGPWDFSKASYEFTSQGIPSRESIERRKARLYYLFGSVEQAQQVQSQLQDPERALSPVWQGLMTGCQNTAVGGSGGAAIGAAFGAPFGPPGAAAGGLLGSGIGALVGLDSGRRQKNVLYGEKEIEKFIAGLIQIYLDYRGKKITLVKAQERRALAATHVVYSSTPPDSFIRVIYDELGSVLNDRVRELELLDADFERYQNQAKKRHEVLIDTVEREELLKRAQVEQRLRQAEELLASQNLLTQFNELANDKS